MNVANIQTFIYCRNGAGVWSYKLAELLTPLLQLFSGMAHDAMKGIFSTSIFGNILNNSFHPHQKEGSIQFSKWRVCSRCSFQCLLGGLAESVQLSVQLRVEKLCPFSLLQHFRRPRRLTVRNTAWRKYLTLVLWNHERLKAFSSTLQETWV